MESTIWCAVNKEKLGTFEHKLSDRTHLPLTALRLTKSAVLLELLDDCDETLRRRLNIVDVG